MAHKSVIPAGLQAPQQDSVFLASKCVLKENKWCFNIEQQSARVAVAELVPPSLILSQGLCTCCSVCLGYSFPQVSTWLAYGIIQISSQITPPQRALPWLLLSNMVLTLPTLKLSTYLSCFIFFQGCDLHLAFYMFMCSLTIFPNKM